MKLLIVDDEKLTRTGIAHSVDWKDFGIDEVFEAANGLQGLSCVKQYHPEIILSDVRMPKMDGIHMAETIQQINPESVVIFMSGYSDTEYLKAAIRLRAINYVEKPVDIEELKKAVEDAVKTIQTIQQTKRTNLQAKMEKHSRLALLLLHPVTVQTRELAKELALFQCSPLYSATAILQLNLPISSLKKELLEENLNRVNGRFQSLHLSQIHAQTHDRNLIFHIYTEHAPDSLLLRQAAEYLGNLFLPLCTWSLSIGRTVSAMEEIYLSYESAAVLLQSAFTCPYNSILIYGECEDTPTAVPEDFRQDFREAVNKRQKEEALAISGKLYHDYSHCRNAIPSQIKDSYYRYFMLINEALSGNGILHSENSQTQDTWNRISLSTNLMELKELLDNHIEQYFDLFKNSSPENPTIFMIKDFISQHYSNETLSIRDISTYVHLSAAYLCTLFKSETGVTINQYLTDFRMAQAKVMLEDPRYKITDISSSVGYSDGGYFGKSFKKTVGLSPSEYREKMQK